MKVYFNEFGGAPRESFSSKLTPGKLYDAVVMLEPNLYKITDDMGRQWAIRLDEESWLTQSMWYAVPGTETIPNVDPVVSCVSMMMRDDTACEAGMQDEGVLSHFELPELDTLYVRAVEFKAVADRLAEAENQLADLKSENTALIASIEHVNEILGPNADTDETLASKLERRREDWRSESCDMGRSVQRRISEESMPGDYEILVAENKKLREAIEKLDRILGPDFVCDKSLADKGARVLREKHTEGFKLGLASSRSPVFDEANIGEAINAGGIASNQSASKMRITSSRGGYFNVRAVADDGTEFEFTGRTVE